MSKESDPLKPVVALCKRRGFIYPGSDIYGGFANTYSYGPYGAELKRTVKNLWWKMFVQERDDMVGIDGPILMHPLVWQASGHIESFNDLLIDCKSCKARYRADHLIEAQTNKDVEGLSADQVNEILIDFKIQCPHCGKKEFTEPRHFNLMFQTEMNKTSNKEKETAYLRPETAQAIFVDFKNITDTMRVRIPFGIAQIGKAFRNEITPGNFIFRTIEFEQMEIEYFIEGEQWQKYFEEWLGLMRKWCNTIGLKNENLKEKEHAKEKLSHYSKRTVDITYNFPFGNNELYGLAYRTDYDLSQHNKFSSTKQEYIDPVGNKRFIPHVIEPSFGVDRTILALLCDAFYVETLENNETRNVLKFAPRIAPVKAAVFPLMKKETLVQSAQKIYAELKPLFSTEYDDGGAIGRRYRRQDEIGTPFCITVDYQTLEDSTVTIRDRDSMRQTRISKEKIAPYLKEKLSL